jgi:hypothetical protein
MYIHIIPQIHLDSDVLPILREVMDAMDIDMWFQPCYSPEFNVCERVFAFVKNKIRSSRIPDVNIVTHIEVLLASVDIPMMQHWYVRSILGKLP